MTLQPSNLLHLCDDIQWKIGKEIKLKRIEGDAKKRKAVIDRNIQGTDNMLYLWDYPDPNDIDSDNDEEVSVVMYIVEEVTYFINMDTKISICNEFKNIFGGEIKENNICFWDLTDQDQNKKWDLFIKNSREYLIVEQNFDRKTPFKVLDLEIMKLCRYLSNTEYLYNNKPVLAVTASAAFLIRT